MRSPTSSTPRGIDRCELPPDAPAWVTVDLLHHTVALWSRRYGRPIGQTEAIEILTRVGRLLDLIVAPTAARPRAGRNA